MVGLPDLGYSGLEASNTSPDSPETQGSGVCFAMRDNWISQFHPGWRVIMLYSKLHIEPPPPAQR